MAVVRRQLVVGTCALLALAASGCHPPPTAIDVALSTDAPSERMLTVRATVREGSSTTGDGGTHTFTIGPLGTDRLPGDFAILPGGTATDSSVTLVLEVQLAAGDHGEPAVAFRRVETWRFVPGFVQHQSIVLSVGCAAAATDCARTDVACTVAERCDESGTTCGDNGMCAPIGVPGDGGTDAQVVPDVAGDAAPMDVAVLDAAPMDAPVVDAAMDAAPMDAAPTDVAADAPRDVPTDRGLADAPRDMGVDAPSDTGGGTVAPGGLCTDTAECAAGQECVTLGGGLSSRCLHCGQAGEVQCTLAGAPSGCAAGLAPTAVGPVVFCEDDAVRHQRGSTCSFTSQCMSGMQAECYTGTGTNGVCLDCGTAGNFCCCPMPGGTCRCFDGSRCGTGLNGVTLCY